MRVWHVSYIICLCFLLTGCWRKKNDTTADSLYRQAVASIGERKYEDAQKFLQNSISLNIEQQKDSALTEDYLLLGYINDRMGEYDSVAPAFQQAISIAHSSGDRKLESRGKLSLAEFYLKANLHKQAISNASDAATISVWLSDWENAFASFEIVRAAQHAMGKYPEEERTLDTLDSINRKWLGNAKERNLYEARFDLLLKSKRLNELTGLYSSWRLTAAMRNDSVSLLRTLLLWGDVKQEQHQLDSALRSYTQALSLLNFYENTPMRLEVLASLGNLSMRTGKIEDATRYYLDALGQAKKIHYLPVEEILSLQTIACEWLNQRKQSRDSTRYDEECEKTIREYKENGCATGEPYGHFLTGKILENRGLLLAALRHYREAFDGFKRNPMLTREGIASSVMAAFMEEERSDWYDAPMSILCSVGNAQDAFELAELDNLQDFREFFLQLPVNSNHAGYSTEITQLQWNYCKHILAQREILEELQTGGADDIERIHNLSDRDGAVPDTSNPAPSDKHSLPEKYQWLFYTKMLSIKQTQDSLPKDAAVIVYVPLSKALYAIVVKHDTSFIRRSVVEREYLRSLVNEYEGLTGSTDSNMTRAALQGATGRINSLSAILYSHFISPVLPVIDGITKLYFIQNKSLSWLPVHTLRGESGPLIGKFDVHYLPSSAVLLFDSPAERRTEQVAGIGHPGRTGWDVEYELKDIRAFTTNAKLFFDTSATLANLSSVTCDLLHICSDLTVIPANPEGCSFTLSDRTTNSGLQDIPIGNLFSITPPGTLLFSNISSIPGGMARYVPFISLVNGSGTFIGTFWQGDHKSKKYFGELFYTGLLNGLSAKDAYTQAMRKLSADHEYSSPRQWGLYYLFGK
ncbi:MAG: CHAT domain-containing protein [Bacteroidota bacterium]